MLESLQSVLESLQAGNQEHALGLLLDLEDELGTERVLEFTTPIDAGDTETAMARIAEHALDLHEKTFSAKQRRDLAKTGAALPDGSFPIATQQDLLNAIHAIGRASDPAKAKAHIKSRAKALGLTSVIPPNWKESDEGCDCGGTCDCKKKAAEALTNGLSAAFHEAGDCKDGECPYEHIEEAIDETWITEAQAGFIEEALEGTNAYRVTLIQAGPSKNRRFWDGKLLQQSSRMFEGTKAFADHPSRSEMADRPERSIKDIIGWYENVRYSPSSAGGGLHAGLHLLDGPIAQMVREAHARGKPDLVQLSVNVSGRVQPKSINGVMMQSVQEIHRVHSVDAVTEASAGGSIDRLVASDRISKEVEELAMLDKITPEELAALLEGREDLQQIAAKYAPAADPDPKPEPEPEEPTPEAQRTSASDETLAAVTAQLEEMQHERQIERCEAKLDRFLGESNLPAVVQSKLRRRFEGRVFEQAELETEIDSERDTLQQLSIARMPQDVPWSGPSEAEPDRYAKAMDGLLAGKSVDGVTPFKNLRHAYSVLSGTNSFEMDGYEVLESARGYDSGINNRNLEHITEATASLSTTFSKLLGDSITRRALQEYQYPDYQTWRKFARVTSVSDLRQQKRERLGEFYLLKRDTSSSSSQTAENNTYADLSAQALPDEEAYYMPQKAHGQAALTIEAVINDDIGKLRKIPVTLGRSAIGLIFVTVYDFFSNNPTESTYLTSGSAGARLVSRNATRAPGNLVTDTTSTDGTPVALNDANMADAKIRFRQMQAAVSASAPFTGARSHSFIMSTPRHLIVAPQNEAMAIALRDSISKVNTNTHEVNIHQGSFDLTVVPYWQGTTMVINAGGGGTYTLTAKNMWFLTGDADEVPIVEIGFLNGREEPEIFVQDGELLGAKFTNDVITYKVRHFWGANPMDHRGVVGATFTT